MKKTWATWSAPLPWMLYAGCAMLGQPGWGGLAALMVWVPTRVPKIRGVGALEQTFGFFFGCVAMLGFVFPYYARVYAGTLLFTLLAVMSLGTTLAGRPFVLRYARKDVAATHWNDPHFLRVVGIVTWVWTAVFFGAAAGAFWLSPRVAPAVWPVWGITGSCLVFGGVFTACFPRWYRRHVHALPDP